MGEAEKLNMTCKESIVWLPNSIYKATEFSAMQVFCIQMGMNGYVSRCIKDRVKHNCKTVKNMFFQIFHELQR